MLKIILIIVASLILLFFYYILANAKRGLSVAKHLHMFELVYNKHIDETGSKEIALINAFRVLSTCPRLKELTSSEVTAAIQVLKNAPDPMYLIRYIIMKMDSKTAFKALSNATFLQDIVEISIKSHEPVNN